jgi:diguanylate cyclase (GGDEF)-like protein
MMLRTLLPGLPQRYAFAGSAIGALLPILGFSSEALSVGPDFRFAERLQEPVHALMLVVPMLAGITFYWFGKTRDVLSTRLQARERSERALLKLSMQDRLTGLPNRRAFEREFQRFIAARKQGEFRPALLLLDLDKFKHINDTMGHDAGDELLKQFADRLGACLGPLVRLFRLGGDEFVVTVAGSPQDGDVERLCRMIKAKAEEPFMLAAGKAMAGVSIGVSYLEPADASMGEVMKRADIALYAAKDIMGSAHAFHSEGLGELVVEQTRAEQEIADAFAKGEFFLEYQPIADASNRAFNSFEALVRWRHPTLGTISPQDFLPAAKRSGHMTDLGRWVITHAVGDAATWPDHIGVAVNVTGGELCDPAFIEHIHETLAQHGLDPSRLTIEITEMMFAADIDAVRAALADLRSRGITIAIDDFGLASISHLRQFPIDRLKVDRAFTSAMVDSSRETELVDLMMKVGKVFGVPATVEGIETETQMDLAVKMGASAVQGFHISHPVPADTVQTLISAGFAPQKPAFLISA